MLTKPKRTSARQRLPRELSTRLSELLTQRDHGLMTQQEFEDALDDVGRNLPRTGTLTETGLTSGGTRLVLREASTGAILARFEFRRAYRADM